MWAKVVVFVGGPDGGVAEQVVELQRLVCAVTAVGRWGGCPGAGIARDEVEGVVDCAVVAAAAVAVVVSVGSLMSQFGCGVRKSDAVFVFSPLLLSCCAWYFLTTCGAWTFSTSSHVLSLSGYPFHLIR